MAEIQSGVDIAFFLVLYVALVSRAFQLQVVSGETLGKLADRQHKASLTLYPERRFIFDRNGQKLAATIMADSVYVDPSNVEDRTKVSSNLSSILGVKRQKITGALSNQGSFRWIARQISPVRTERIRTLKLKGVHLVQEPRRFYPHRELACHLLGFAGLDSTGLDGLESKYDEYLKGVPKKVVWGRDARGRKIYLSDDSGSAVDDRSCSLFLTIDSKIQYIVESQLKKAIEDTGAKGEPLSLWIPGQGRCWQWPMNPCSILMNFPYIPQMPGETGQLPIVLIPVPFSNPLWPLPLLRKALSRKRIYLTVKTGLTQWVTGLSMMHRTKNFRNLTCRILSNIPAI